MATFAFLLTLVLTMTLTSYFRVGVKYWSMTLLLLLLIFGCFYAANVYVVIPISTVVILVAIILNVPALRIRLLSQWLFTVFKKKMPPISVTEQQVIAAGDTGWEAQLFQGSPNWCELLAQPKPILSTEEQLFIDHQVSHLCELLDDWEMLTEYQDIPPVAWEYIKREKFLGMIIDKQYGGLGFSATAHSAIISKIASRSYSAAVSIMVPNSLGPAEFIQAYGTIEQKNNYLARLANGEEMPCFALTAPTVGSDASGITDKGIVTEGMYQGKKVIGIRLNWDKRYITLAPVATLAAVVVKVYDPDHFLGNTIDMGMTVCLIPTDLPGVSLGERHKPMNLAFMNGPVRGVNVFIPIDLVIGGAESIGKGWQMMMSSLAVGRGISLPAVSTGSATNSFRTTGAYARVREQFNTTLGQFEGVQKSLARIGGLTYLSESARVFSAASIDAGYKPAIATAITKFHLTENCRTIVNDAMDIHAGRGIMTGARNYLVSSYLSVPVGITVEGANILTRNLIIFGQGAVRCHPYIAKEMEAANNPDAFNGLARFDHLFFDHIGYIMSNWARALLQSLTSGRFIRVKQAAYLRPFLRQLTRMSTALACVTDIVMFDLGGELKRRENISARLGDVLSELFLASTVIKYYHDAGQAVEDQPFVTWCLQRSLYRIQTAFDGFFENLPRRWLARLLKQSLFFWGGRYQPPKDCIESDMAIQMMQESDLRQRLLQYNFISDDSTDAIQSLEKAFAAALGVADLQKRLKEAVAAGRLVKLPAYDKYLAQAYATGIVTKEEVDQLQSAYDLQMDVIQVDAYPQG